RTQAAAAEAQRLEAERARIASEQQRQKDMANARRRKQEQSRIREQARLAALAEAQRLALEQARIAAESARWNAQVESQEKERIDALKIALAAAEADAEALAQHFAAEQARLQNEMEERIEGIKNQLQKEHQSLEVRRNVIRTATDVARRQTQLANRELQKREKLAKTEHQAKQARLTAQRRALSEARWRNPEFANAGSMAVFGPVFTGTLGAINNNPTSAMALATALRKAVSIAIATASTAAAPILVGFAALLVPSELGNGDLYSASVPLSNLAPGSLDDLYELAVTGKEVDIPFRLGSRTVGNRVEIVVVSTDGVSVPSNIPVRKAHFDTKRNVYVSTVAPAGSGGPIVTWTPLVEPLNPSTDFPLLDTELPIYEGADVTPDSGRIDPFPQLDLYGFGGFITIFPIESGIPPIFTMFRDRRQDPGIVSGMGQPVSVHWLGAASTPQGAPIPEQIADKFRGREFSSFRSFRRAFWKAVASDSILLDQFSQLNKIDMRDGLAPSARPNEQIGKRQKFEIHHIKPISQGGEVYDVNNLTVLTPHQHIKFHSKKGEI
ncbi:S-type pyocin domain-containing protein, partial [Pseudomonas sp. NPDC087346]|uniref:S-type pyocin domain-containing protein n=1 Tax=Pseudomonas sp. NPDC087346 TaxID=3364438 RepID=UPI00382F6E86